jgi:MFS family permease
MKRMRWYDYITVNLFWIGLNIRNNAVGVIFTPFLVDAVVSGDVKNTALGFLRTAGLVVAMLVQPAIGLLSDRCTSRFGRRRPFIFAGVLFDLIFLAAIGLSTDYWALFAATLLIQVSANVSHGALQGLIPDLVPEDQRGRASAVKAIFELIPLVVMAFTIARLVGAGHFGWAVFATGAALFVTMILTVGLVKEQPLRDPVNTPLRPSMLRVLGMLAGIAAGGVAGLAGGGVIGGLAGLLTWPLAGAQTALLVGLGLGGLAAMTIAVIGGVWVGALSTLGQDARRHASFTWWIVNRLLFLAAVTSVQGFAPYFLMHVFSVGRETAADMTGSLMAVVGVCTLLAALPGGWLSDRLGRKPLLAACGVLAALGTFLLLATLQWSSMPLIYAAGCVIGLAAGPFTSINWALGTELAPPQEAGRYLGISNLAGAGAGMIGSGIGGPLADFLNQQQPGLGYVVIFACYGALFAFSAVSLLGVRRGHPSMAAAIPTPG